jgi:mitochondrial fission protein ELM1
MPGRAVSDYTDYAQQDSVWAVVSYRAGESSQILGLAKRLELPFEIKKLSYSRWVGPVGLARRVSSAGIDSTSLPGPPWPALIISAGVKNEPVCRWFQAQSGGRTRLVFLGRTWAARRHFDLVITTPQYRLPHEPNVIHNLMTQHGVTTARLAEARQRWEGPLAGLRRPLIGVLIGGDSGPLAFGERAAGRLARALNTMARSVDGSILATTSARTRASAVDKLERLLGPGAQVYRWREDDEENPYYGLLAHADRLVVTSDSIAMLSEAVGTGKPVYLFDLAGLPADATLKSRVYGAMMKLGPQRLSRDLGLFHQRYVEDGFGAWLGSEAASVPADPEAEIDATVSRVLALLERR